MYYYNFFLIICPMVISLKNGSCLIYRAMDKDESFHWPFLIWKIDQFRWTQSSVWCCHPIKFMCMSCSNNVNLFSDVQSIINLQKLLQQYYISIKLVKKRHHRAIFVNTYITFHPIDRFPNINRYFVINSGSYITNGNLAGSTFGWRFSQSIAVTGIVALSGSIEIYVVIGCVTKIGKKQIWSH